MVLGFEDGYYKYVQQFFKTHGEWANYQAMIHGGWIECGTKKDVPKHACWVGHYCDRYVWVTPDCEQHLAQVTLAILDIATIDTTSASATLATIEPKPKVYAVTTPKLIPLPQETDVQKAIKERLKDLLDIPFKTEGEYRQAIRSMMKDIAGVTEAEIQSTTTTLLKEPPTGGSTATGAQATTRFRLTPRFTPVPAGSPPTPSPP